MIDTPKNGESLYLTAQVYLDHTQTCPWKCLLAENMEVSPPKSLITT